MGTCGSSDNAVTVKETAETNEQGEITDDKKTSFVSVSVDPPNTLPNDAKTTFPTESMALFCGDVYREADKSS